MAPAIATREFTMTTYTRRIRISLGTELQPGDLVDISSTLDPCWEAVGCIGGCGDDTYEDADCDNDCDYVIFFAGQGIPPWHVVDDSDEVYARLLATDDQVVVDAENAAHTAAQVARNAA